MLAMSCTMYYQDYMLTELPNTLTVFDSNYESQYSASYTGNINEVSSSIDFQYYTSFANAIQMLLQENYSTFLVTVRCNTVAIYCNGNGQFKVFDSHARDMFGLPHPHGTCVLLDIDNLIC